MALACDGAAPIDDAGIGGRIYARFEPAADPMDFGAVPFPDDLYLGSDGRIALGALPGEADAIPADYPESVRVALRDLDGFSVNAPVFFSFPPNSLDPASLAESGAASTREDSSVFLVDVDPASATAFRKTPVRVNWQPEIGQLALRPDTGHPLVPGRRYAAVITRSVRDDLGDPIGVAPRFLEVRDASAPPTDPLMREVYNHYDPVLIGLAGVGIPRAHVAALAVFTVQNVSNDMRDARARIYQAGAPVVALEAVVPSGPELDALLGTPLEDVPGVDVEGGVIHDHIGWLIHGSFPAPWFLSDEAGVHGRLRRDAEGALITTRSEQVPFTLTLPVGDLDRSRVVVFQHGLGSERSVMLAVADELAAAGWATLAIDIPFHGRRFAANADVAHNYGDSAGPDGFGDRTGNDVYLAYLGVIDNAGEFPAFNPTYPRDVIRQSAFDLMTLVRVIREGDWSAVTETSGLTTLAFAEAPLAFVGVSLGGIVGTVFVASEPEVGAAVLSVTGGDFTVLVERSASIGALFLPILLPKLGVDLSALDPVGYPSYFRPEVALVQTLFDRGDSMSFAEMFAARDLQLLFQIAEDDETVPNSSTEALARAADAPLLDGAPVFTDLTVATAPVRENVDGATVRVTRGAFRFAPAAHGLLTHRNGVQQVAHPPEPPFIAVSPVPIANPNAAALEQVVRFFESWQEGRAEIVAPIP